jgi:hypothetical protein
MKLFFFEGKTYNGAFQKIPALLELEVHWYFMSLRERGKEREIERESESESKSERASESKSESESKSKSKREGERERERDRESAGDYISKPPGPK